MRFSNVYGPGSNFKNSVIAKFIKDYVLNKKNKIYGDGNQTRDFIYIDDLVDAILRTLFNNRLKKEVFQISTNKETKINDLNKIIIKKLKEFGHTKLRTVYKPNRKGDVKKNYSSNLKAKKILKWIPKKNLSKGIEDTIKYFNIFLVKK